MEQYDYTYVTRKQNYLEIIKKKGYFVYIYKFVSFKEVAKITEYPFNLAWVRRIWVR